jgi:SAM-dependent methyltransferase
MGDRDEVARDLAAKSLAEGDPTGWFEPLYGTGEVPWDRSAPHSLLVRWGERHAPDGHGLRALVVGCGFGRDAEYVAGFGYDTVAFDIAPSAVKAAQERYPGSAVRYVVADLLSPPADWRRAYDLVVESMTVQSLPPDLHPAAIASVREFVAPGGRLLVVAAAESGVSGGPPWPLTRAEIDSFASGGLAPVRVEKLDDRWSAEFLR